MQQEIFPVKKTEDTKSFYYFDEAGSPAILARGGVNLVKRAQTSKTFIIGYLETKNPKDIGRRITDLRKSICSDEYLKDIPSMVSTNMMFHANKDCAEVREKVFKLLKESDFTVYVVVARKDETLFRRKFNLNAGKLYGYLVEKLTENRLHLYSEIDCYFSCMGNIVRQRTMQDAIDAAKKTFDTK